jgi:hypothetical protein
VRRDLAHAAKSCRPSAAKQIHEERLDQIIGMMRQKNHAATAATRDPGKKFVARGAPGCLDGLPGSRCHRAHIFAADLASEFVLAREPANKSRVQSTRSAAQFVIEMANDQFAIPEGQEPMKQHHGIATAGNANQVTGGNRKSREEAGVPINAYWFEARHSLVNVEAVAAASACFFRAI